MSAQEIPLAPAHYPEGTKQPDSGLPITSETQFVPLEESSSQVNGPFSGSAWQSRFNLEDKEKHELRVNSKYDTLNSMNHEDKVKALKNIHLDPEKIQDPYDGLANALNRWKVIATSDKAKGANAQQKDWAARNYYRYAIAPLYQKMKAEPVSEDLWMKQAYGRALEYDLDSSYGSHWKQGFYGWFHNMDNTMKFGLTSIVGGNVEGLELWKGLVNAATGNTKEDFVAKVGEALDKIHKQGVLGTLRSDTEKVPLVSSAYHALQRASDDEAFYHDINPAQGKWDKARSFIIEQGMMLPFYETMGGFNAAGIKMAGEANLTKSLLAKPGGEFVAKLLTNGAEGAAYGLTMRDDGDKKNAWQDALGQAIIGTVFHIGGATLKSATPATAKMAQKLGLAAKGFKQGTAEELRSAIVQSSAGTMAAGGRVLDHSINEEALNVLREGQGKAPQEAGLLRKQRLKEDPTRWQKVYEKASYIRALTKGKDLNDPEVMAGLIKELHDIQNDAGDSIEGLNEVAKNSAETSVQKNTFGRKTTIEKFIEDQKRQDAEAGLKERPPEVYQKLALQEMAKRQAKATKLASKKNTSKPIQEAVDIHERRVSASKKIAPSISQSTRYSVNKAGEPSVSFNTKHSWIVYAKNAVKDAGLKWDSAGIKKWLEGMQPEDFEKDLYEHFMPKELKDMGLFFESQHEKSLGRQNPNFLAFMHNYSDQMPKEFAEHLSETLEDRMKVEKNLDPAIDTETQKDYYARGMWNHVADFLHSPSFANGERNVYRTTLENMKAPTKWQMRMNTEIIREERAMIQEMFKGNPSAFKDATTAYDALSSLRTSALKEGDQKGRKAAIEGIDSILTRTGDREKVDF